MFDGRISFDGIATVKNFVVGSYFPTALKSRKKPAEKFCSVTYSNWMTCAVSQFSTGKPQLPQKPKQEPDVLYISNTKITTYYTILNVSPDAE
jgi:hypothetical protein